MGHDIDDGEGGAVKGIAIGVILGIGFYVGCWVLGRVLGWW